MVQIHPERFGDDNSALAAQLRERWLNNDFTPRPLRTEDEDSDDENNQDSDNDLDRELFGASCDADDTGIMRGILTVSNANGRAVRKLDKRFTRDFKSFGHNSIRIGQWWPYQVCALRDGAHGAMQGGISGSVNDGAYSVVLAGGLSHAGDEYQDRDNFEQVWYSGSDSADRKLRIPGSAPPMTNNTKALMQSYYTKRPVRVLRAKACSKWAPPYGYRYDGLYKITGKKIVGESLGGGGKWQFHLTREPNQPPHDELDLRPNKQEQQWFRYHTEEGRRMDVI